MREKLQHQELTAGEPNLHYPGILLQQPCPISHILFSTSFFFFLQCLNVELHQQISCENLDFKLWFVFAAAVRLVLRFPFPGLSTVLPRSSVWDYPCSDCVNCANKPHQTTTWTLLNLWKNLLLKLTVFCSEAWEGWDRQRQEKTCRLWGLAGKTGDGKVKKGGKDGKVKARGWLQKQATWTV